MEIKFSENALKELNFWKQSGNTIILKKIRALVESINASPFDGIGKPEPLKNNLSGYWSRRITQEHRLIYKVENDTIII